MSFLDKAEKLTREHPANKELMELGFGCQYEYGGGHRATMDSGNYVVDRELMTMKIISICNHTKNTPCCGVYQNQNDEPETYKITKILGKPPHLEHYLRVLGSIETEMETIIYTRADTHIQYAFLPPLNDDFTERGVYTSVTFNLTTGKPATEKAAEEFIRLVTK